MVHLLVAVLREYIANQQLHHTHIILVNIHQVVVMIAITVGMHFMGFLMDLPSMFLQDVRINIKQQGAGGTMKNILNKSYDF